MEILVILPIIWLIVHILNGEKESPKPLFRKPKDDIVPTKVRNMSSPYGNAKVECAYHSLSEGTSTAKVITLPDGKEWGWVTEDSQQELEARIDEVYEQLAKA